MTTNRFRKSRFADDPGSRVSYTPTVSRALIEEADPGIAIEGMPSDFVAVNRDSWDEIEHVPAPESDLPLPMVTQVDSEEMEPIAVARMARIPRDSLDLGSPESFAPLPLPPSTPPEDTHVRLGSLPTRAVAVAVEHALWTQARALLAADQRDATADVLERLCIEQPDHEQARSALLRICLMLGRVERVGLHTAWLMRGQLQSGRNAEACATYQHVRITMPSANLPEGVLVAALTAADGENIGSIVLDATNLLIKHYAASPQAPKALLVTAKHQLMSHAQEAAVQTLRYLVSSYPGDPAAEPARRKLSELSAL